MTPDRLQHLLDTTPPGSWPSPRRPDALLRAVEAAADRAPQDRTLSDLAREVGRLASADLGLEPIVAGIRRERLIRWDEDTTTWIGVDVPTGTPGMVRVLRPGRGDAAAHRWIAREGRALSALIPGLRCDGTALAAPAPGAPFDAAPLLGARVLGNALEALICWEAQGMGPPPLIADELRVGPDGVRLVCLTAVSPEDAGDNLAWLARQFEDGGDTALDRVVRGLIALPSRRVADAAEHLVQALAEDLAGHRHTLAERARRSRQQRALARLLDQVIRLDAALPPPRGRGAVGVDLDGRITMLQSDEHGIRWGPEGALATLWSPTDGFDAVSARRMLRARAAAPPNPLLDARIDGDPAATEQIGRWVAASLRLRTLILLLQKALAA